MIAPRNSHPLALCAALVVAGSIIVVAALTHAHRTVSRNASHDVATRPAAQFTDVAAQAGLAFQYANGRNGMATILEESGSGCAIFDYDGDGWPDIYLLNGRDLYGHGSRTRNALYHNNGDGTFTDVTEKAGVPGTGYGLGVAVGDFDNDGHPDIYICQWGRNVLYHNNGDGTFTDVTEKAGVGAQEFGADFHTGAAWIDYDHDGRLDLFVCSYVKLKEKGLRYCRLANGILTNCPPSAYEGTPGILYHNNGDGTFTNVTRQAGLYFPGGKQLSALTCDFNDDGWTDLMVGQDGEEAELFRNNRNGTFTNVAAPNGIAFAEDGATMAAMGIDLGDFMNEGLPGLFVADFSKRPDHLWRRSREGFFSEVSTPSGIARATFDYLGFGAGFIDYDNDGWLDLFVANGHVYPEIEQSSSDEHYLQNNQLFHNQRDGTFLETTAQAGPALQIRHAGRGAAFGDLFNDGNMDIVVNNNDGPPVLLRNSGVKGNHFLSLLLIGARSNRDAIGARVDVKAGALKMRGDVRSGGSYLSSSDVRLHFGLGPATQADQITVRWPSGLKQQFGPLAADRFYALREGDATAHPQSMRPASPIHSSLLTAKR
jgi:hypothetical protein